MNPYKVLGKVSLESIALKVKDIDVMIDFYTKILEFALLVEENDVAYLGTKNERKILLSLMNLPEGKEQMKRQTGLHHFAVELSSRKKYAEFIQHLKNTLYPIDSITSHGYCESVYVTDPEGNSIEIIYHLPQEEWKVNADGSVSSLVDPLDLESIVSENTMESYLIPEDTRLGHVDFSVTNLQESREFYENILGFTTREYEFPGTSHLTAGNKHHHIGLNVWNGAASLKSQDDYLGIDYVAFKFENEANLIELKEQLQKEQQDFYYNKGKQIVQIDDPNGIHLWFYGDRLL